MDSCGTSNGPTGCNLKLSFTTISNYGNFNKSVSSTILFIPTTRSSSSCTCFITHGYLKSWEKVHSIAAAKVSYAPEIMSIMIALIFHQTRKNYVLDKINMFLIWTQNAKPNGYYICDSKRFVHVTHSIMLCFFSFCVHIYIYCNLWMIISCPVSHYIGQVDSLVF